MSGELLPHLSATQWTCSFIAAVVLYVLSIGPVIGLGANRCLPGTPETWIAVVYAPVDWLAGHTALDSPIQRWCNWWVALIETP